MDSDEDGLGRSRITKGSFGYNSRSSKHGGGITNSFFSKKTLAAKEVIPEDTGMTGNGDVTLNQGKPVSS